MIANDWDDLVQAAQTASAATGLPISEVSLDEIARHAGLSRATLYRRIGSRRALEEAIQAAGIDAEGRGDVRERATAAAADLIERDGLAAMTLEDVAERADCSVRTLHSQLGGREGLLVAVFERYSPLPRIEQLMTELPRSLEDGVKTIYTTILDTTGARRGLLLALVSDITARPDGLAARYARETYLPRVMQVLVPWLKSQVQSGAVRPLPTSLLMELLVGPVAAHALLGPVLQSRIDDAPISQDKVVSQMTDAFVRAVAPAPD